MSRAAVICEFNPFHNGHKFLLEKIKSTCADEIVCIMSGGFVQRGDIAVVNKYERAKAALLNGADLVVELPTAYAVSSARVFARNGVRIARSLSCDMLCFGAESELCVLEKIVDAIEDNSVKELIKRKSSTGLYYPKALEEAVEEVCGKELSAWMSLPNNILAIEYIRSCREAGITPVAFERKGVSHDSSIPSGDIASASAIRQMIQKGEDYARYTPMTIKDPAALSAIESAVIYTLKCRSAQEISALSEVSEGLENRILDAAQRYNSIEEILEAVKTKRYTHARLRRIMIYSLLGVTASIQNTPVPYLRILGVREGKEHLLKDAALPLVAKVKADYEALNNSSKEIFDLDIRATHAMNLVRNESINEFSEGIIKIK